VDSFRALSATLTGFDESQLDAGFADALRRALLGAGHAANLAALAATATARTPETAALETAIVSAWYSGVLPGAPPVVAASAVRHKDEFQGAGHIIGTCRMGADAKTSVVDANLRAHDHPNLHVVGSAVFPTSGTANPTLTIAALALRLAERLKRALATS